MFFALLYWCKCAVKLVHRGRAKATSENAGLILRKERVRFHSVSERVRALFTRPT